MNAIVQWNVNGFNSRLPFLQKLISDISPVIIALQETKLDANQNVYLRNYKIYRKDRDGRGGGGVLLAIHNSIPNHEINIDSTLEFVACSVYFKNKRLNVASIYIPSDLQLLNEDLEDVFNQLEGGKLILGDFNAKHDLWGSNINDNRGGIIADFILDNNINVLNSGSPTYCRIQDDYFSHIDISLVSFDIFNNFSWETYDSLMDSDHYPIIIKYQCGNLYEKTNSRWILSKADWERYRDSVDIPKFNKEGSLENIKILSNDVTKTIIYAATISVKKKIREL